MAHRLVWPMGNRPIGRWPIGPSADGPSAHRVSCWLPWCRLWVQIAAVPLMVRVREPDTSSSLAYNLYVDYLIQKIFDLEETIPRIENMTMHSAIKLLSRRFQSESIGGVIRKSNYEYSGWVKPYVWMNPDPFHVHINLSFYMSQNCTCQDRHYYNVSGR